MRRITTNIVRNSDQLRFICLEGLEDIMITAIDYLKALPGDVPKERNDRYAGNEYDL
jgi:hypothetical protein